MKTLVTLCLLWTATCSVAAAQETTTVRLPGLPGLTKPVPAPVHLSDEDDNVPVRRALEKRVGLQFEDVAFNVALERLAGQLGVAIWLDPEGLEEADAARDQLVTLHLPPVRARHALKMLLEPLHLRTVVRDGVLKITSEEKASEALETRVYNVRDLVEIQSNRAGKPATALTPVPVPEGTKVVLRERGTITYQDFDTLIDLITSTVQPDSWTDNGGQGSISGFPRGSLLVVSQTEDIQEELQQLLNMLRGAADKVAITLPER
jgi:general secretion pathway protein D